MRKLFLSLLTLTSLVSADLFAVQKDQDIYTAPVGHNMTVKIESRFGAQANIQQHVNAGQSYRFRPAQLAPGLYDFKIKSINNLDYTNKYTLFVNPNLPSGFVVLRLSGGMLDINFYDIDADEIPCIEVMNNFGEGKINMARQAANAAICVTYTLNNRSSDISFFDRKTETHMASLRVNAGFAYTMHSVGVNFQPRLTGIGRADLQELAGDARHAQYGGFHGNHAMFKRALLGIKNECPNPRLNLTQTRQAVLDKIAALKADANERVKFNKTLTRNARIDFFGYATDQDRRRIYLASSAADRQHMVDRIAVINGHLLDVNATLAAQRAFLASVNGQAFAPAATTTINTLDYIHVPLGPSVRPARNNMFDDLGHENNRYECRNAIDDNARALQADDIFYVDRIFRRVWELTQNYVPADIPAGQDRDTVIRNARETLVSNLFGNLFVIFEEGHGNVNCNRGKLVQLILTLQGYYPFAQFDAGDQVDARAVAVAFGQQIDRELMGQVAAPMAILQDVIVMQDISPENEDLVEVDDARYTAAVRDARTRFAAAITAIKARFENEGLQNCNTISLRRTALNAFNVTLDRWKTAFEDVLRTLERERNEHIAQQAQQAQAAAANADADADADADDSDDEEAGLYDEPAPKPATAVEIKAAAQAGVDVDDEAEIANFLAAQRLADEWAVEDQAEARRHRAEERERRRQEAQAEHARRVREAEEARQREEAAAAERERQERARADQVERERARREAAERAERERQARERADRVERERQRRAAEQARLEAERQARERAERERRERQARERRDAAVAAANQNVARANTAYQAAQRHEAEAVRQRGFAQAPGATIAAIQAAANAADAAAGQARTQAANARREQRAIGDVYFRDHGLPIVGQDHTAGVHAQNAENAATRAEAAAAAAQQALVAAQQAAAQAAAAAQNRNNNVRGGFRSLRR